MTEFKLSSLIIDSTQKITNIDDYENNIKEWLVMGMIMRYS